MTTSRDEALERWETDYRAVRTALEALDDALLERPTANRGWSVRNLAAHVASDGRYTILNGRRIAAGRDVFPLPVPGAVVFGIAKVVNARTVRAHRKDCVEDLVAFLDATHAEASRFVHSLGPDAWQNSGRMPTMGRLTMSDVLLRTIAHSEEHMRVLRIASTG